MDLRPCERPEGQSQAECHAPAWPASCGLFGLLGHWLTNSPRMAVPLPLERVARLQFENNSPGPGDRFRQRIRGWYPIVTGLIRPPQYSRVSPACVRQVE